MFQALILRTVVVRNQIQIKVSGIYLLQSRIKKQYFLTQGRTGSQSIGGDGKDANSNENYKFEIISVYKAVSHDITYVL